MRIIQNNTFHIVRVGMGITFLWIGVLIFREPEAWGGYLQPWAMHLLPLPIKEIMLGTAFLDVLIGFLLLVDIFTWLASFVGALHIATVLIGAGITAITVRDIGLFTSLVAIAVTAWPINIFPRKRYPPKADPPLTEKINLTSEPHA